MEQKAAEGHPAEMDLDDSAVTNPVQLEPGGSGSNQPGSGSSAASNPGPPPPPPEPKPERHCSLCKNTGHDKRTCPENPANARASLNEEQQKLKSQGQCVAQNGVGLCGGPLACKDCSVCANHKSIGHCRACKRWTTEKVLGEAAMANEVAKLPAARGVPRTHAELQTLEKNGGAIMRQGDEFETCSELALCAAELSTTKGRLHKGAYA